MNLKSIDQAEVSGKKILVRVDFNVELDDVAHVQEGYKLEASKKTIDLLFEKGAAKVVLMSHYGRPEGRVNPEFSLVRMTAEASRYLGRPVEFVDDCVGEKVATAVEKLAPGAVLLLENLRFYPGEEENDRGFAEKLATSFDIYINEAFSCSHRAHASIVAITEFLPSYAGLCVLNELKNLNAIRESPTHPAVAIIGGAKIETKLPLIRALEANYDCVLVGGKIANEAIDQGIQFSEKVLLPQDFDSDQRLDIGPTTAAYYAAIIKKARTIVWNGPMGKFEEKPYDFGTNVVLEAILESEAFVVIGGGESLAVLEKAGVYNKIGFVSSGGGAMLEYLSGKELPGLRALTVA